MEQKLSTFQKLLIIILILSRLTIPFTIFSNPLLGVFLCIIIDAVDFAILMIFGVRLDKPRINIIYQKIDKSLDHYYYFFILLYFTMNFGQSLTLLTLILFIYRSIGFVLFEATGKRKYFFYFINGFENFSIIVLLLDRYAIQFNDFSNLMLIVAIAIITKVPQEIFLHNRFSPALRRKVRNFKGFLYKIVNRIRSFLNLKPYTDLDRNL